MPDQRNISLFPRTTAASSTSGGASFQEFKHGYPEVISPGPWMRFAIGND
jgi:hypothetical protein